MVPCKNFSIFWGWALALGLLLAGGVARLVAEPAYAFSSQAYHLRFTEPKGWKQVPAKSGVIAKYLSPAKPGLRSHISLTVEEVAGLEEITQEHVEHSLMALTDSQEALTVLGCKSWSVNGQKMKRLRLRERSKKHNIDACQVYFVRNQTLYVFTLSAATKNYPKVEPVFLKLLNSIQFI